MTPDVPLIGAREDTRPFSVKLWEGEILHSHQRAMDWAAMMRVHALRRSVGLDRDWDAVVVTVKFSP